MSKARGLLVALLLAVPARAEYHDASALEGALRDVARQDGGLFHLTELARDADGAPVWMMRVGPGEAHAPAVLVVAGLDGRDVLGTELALSHLEGLAAAPDSARALLDGATLYVIPRLNPHGAARFFGEPQAAIAGTRGELDSDGDGLVGEDDVEDLDGDGRIALMRVAGPEGTWVDDGGVLRPANGTAGETGAWRLLPEGRDDDGDEAWNEEADGGVNLARNFPHEYPWFARDAGENQVSETLSRAVADFLVAHPEVAVVLAYGFDDNLLESPSEKSAVDLDPDAQRWGRKPLAGMSRDDLPYLAELGKLYREDLGLGDKAKNTAVGASGVRYPVPGGEEPTATWAARGSLAGYAYFDRGRLALAAPGWTPGIALATAPEDTTKGDDESGGPEDDAAQAEAAFRAWLTERDPDAWLGWTAIDHPDFPGRTVEVGGYAPFAHLAPPVSELPALAEAHDAFLVSVVERLPRVRIRRASLEPRGGGVHALTVTVENTGYLPDVLVLGAYSSHARPTRLEIEGGEILGGYSPVKLDRIPGSGGSVETRLLVKGDRVTVRLVSEMAGSETVTLSSGDVIEGGDR